MIFGFSDVEDMKREPGEIMPDKRRHDFFWIPVWIWGIIMICLGTYMTSGSEVEEETEIAADIPEIIYEGERKVEFFNPTDDTVHVSVKNMSQETVMNDSIPPLYMRWKVLDAGEYQVTHSLGSEKIIVHGSETKENEAYDDGWYVVGGEHDLILLYVNDATRGDIVRSDIRKINWIEKVMKRYKGSSYVIPTLKPKDNYFYSVYGPGINLPLEVLENEKIYSLISIPSGAKMTEEFLDSCVIDVCY